MLVKLCLMIGVLVALGSGEAFAADAAALFEEGLQHDLSDGEDAAKLAFASFWRAAAAGLPEAEFNVAVMLDSGRGVDRDVVQAAVWYARSAIHGDQRAAYNLGQLYEAGEGVPRNPGMAGAWFALSGLPAAREHLKALAPRPGGTMSLSVPVPTSPRAGLTVNPGSGGIEFIWTSMPQPEAVRFFVETRVLSPSGSREAFSGFSGVTGMLMPTPDRPGAYVWRVIAISPRTGQYRASEWSVFRVAPS